MTQTGTIEPLTSLSGIGKQTVSRLHRLGIFHPRDLLFHLPLRYQDRTRIQPVGALSPGQSALFCGTVEYSDITTQGKRSLICRISDGSGSINLRFFHFSASQHRQFNPGVSICCFGEIRSGYHGLEIIHPEYKLTACAQSMLESSLTPVYPLTEGLRQNILRKAITQSLEQELQHIQDLLPPTVLQQNGFPTLADALQSLHQPGADTLTRQSLSKARERLAFEELLAHHLLMLRGKLQHQQQRAPCLPSDPAITRRFLNALPFQLTQAQQRVIAEIETDCSQTHPMLRLVQGDVGSGKTVVAACAALLALNAGFQVAVMAPTELLAEQHLRNFSDWFSGFDCTPALLSGQLKGTPRQQTLNAIADGSARLVIGTHALFQDSVHFQHLGLIIIDEQHRFGVHQRLALREKSRHTGLRPHQLVMTATPIPRTLAMLQYSDLDISIIDQLPPGRKPVTTSVIPSERRNQVIARIRHWVEQHKQAYWVCTLIEESETLQCEAAEKTSAFLAEALPEIRIALVHGRMKATEKESVMQGFKNHDYDLLVATTVIEVGVDVPNAGLMIIENPERLGLSQLHQLRGRVGRGAIESYCLLLYQSPLSIVGKQRLGILRESNDGFVIAEKDLELRGPGEVMGTRQTGQMQFRIADLGRDSALLEQVREAGETICHDYPETIQPIIDRWLAHSSQFAEV